MKQVFFTFSILILALLATGKDKNKDKINEKAKQVVEEGKLLYRSEMASWHGTDIILQKINKEKIGGYFSYPDGEVTKCIFFSKDSSPKVIGAVIFDKSFWEKYAEVDLAERDFTQFEYDLFTIRNNARKAISEDDFFDAPENTSLNMIPLIRNGEKKVYLVTGPKQAGIVILGNDYLLTFDSENRLKDQKRIHVSTMVFDYQKYKGNVGAMHSHVRTKDDLMTATDICTLMLYEKFTDWTYHKVFSSNYISTWDYKTDELSIEKTKRPK